MSFTALRPEQPDPLLSLISEFRSDPRKGKIDLSVGVYRTETGFTPVMGAVKQAEAILQETQPSKTYLGPDGSQDFVQAISPLLFGNAPGRRFVGLQTPGGTGALRVAAELLALGNQPRRIWVGLPTWSNHLPIFAAAGLQVETYPAIDLAGQGFAISGMLEALERARPGDAVLLQGCCHNPTGIDPDAHDWAVIAATLAARGLVPLIDLAYQGLGDGIDADAASAREIVQAVPEALIAYSCDKNFGLYRERVGALYFTADDDALLQSVGSNASALVRANYSMPPDHGAAVVTTILQDTRLRYMWQAELDEMRGRINAIRQAVADRPDTGAIALGALSGQKGMFSLLPLEASAIARLKRDHGIYMAPNGRINLAGLPLSRVEDFTDALQMVADREAA